MAIGFIRNTGTNPLRELVRTPFEKQLDPLGPIDSQGRFVRPFVKYVNYLKQTSVVVDFLFSVTPIVGVCNCSMFGCTLLDVHSCIAIILMGKRELVALLNLSSWCLVMVERLFLAVPRG